MNNQKFEQLWLTYAAAQSEEQQYAIMKEFMFNSSFEELMAWNHYLGEKGDKLWEEHRKTGLSEEDKAWYKEQFARFDDFEKQFNFRKAA